MAFWKAVLKSGTQISENDGYKWDDVKDEVKELCLCTNDGKFVHLPKNQKSYIQAKTASASLGNPQSMQIESRYIGFNLGNNKIIIRVDEKTNNIKVEIQ